MKIRISTTLAMAVAGFLGTASVAQAEPAFARMYKQQFGYSPSCNACHRDGGGSPLNNYGEAFNDADKNLAAFTAIADIDSDGDSASNNAEATAKSNPGAAQSTPDNPGNWLDVSNLIPKLVQATYPDVKQYKPLDALLTESEITRATELGATLDQDDSNTIYIPVSERRAAGAAIIAAGEFEGKSFFVMLAADRTLSVLNAQPASEKDLSNDADKALFASFNGAKLNELPKPTGDGSLKDAIVSAIKNAGTLIYVRLKKS